MSGTPPKFKVGDMVKITESGKTGIVKVVFDANVWSMWAPTAGHEYAIQLDDGSVVNLTEKPLELVDVCPVIQTYERKCDCGLRFAPSGGVHSDWCKLAGKHQGDHSSKYNTSSGDV